MVFFLIISSSSRCCTRLALDRWLSRRQPSSSAEMLLESGRCLGAIPMAYMAALHLV